jgi:DNA polymerase III subunit chi
MAGQGMEVMFYHLERRPLERVLPILLERTRARNWRAVVQARTSAQLRLLDDLLWTYAEGSFLPHCSADDARAVGNPIVLTIDTHNPNAADVRFLIDAVATGDPAGYRRLVHLFDGTDADIVATARAAWKALKPSGAALSYWQQNDAGQWQQHA